MSSQHTRLLPTLNVFHKTVVHTFCMHSPWVCRQGIQQSLYVRHNVQPHLSEVTGLSFNSVSADACTWLKQAACSGCLTAALFKLCCLLAKLQLQGCSLAHAHHPAGDMLWHPPIAVQNFDDVTSQIALGGCSCIGLAVPSCQSKACCREKKGRIRLCCCGCGSVAG